MGIFSGTSYHAGDTQMKPDGKHIRGVSCDVHNCVYHDGDTHCTAERIAVGPSYATSCTDTVCATFRQKNL